MKKAIIAFFLLIFGGYSIHAQVFKVTNVNPSGLGSLYQALRDSYSDTDPSDDQIVFETGSADFTIDSKAINYFTLRKDTFPTAAQDRLVINGLGQKVNLKLNYSVLSDVDFSNIHVLDNVTFIKSANILNNRFEQGFTLGWGSDFLNALSGYVVRNNEILSGSIYLYGYVSDAVISQNFLGISKTGEKGTGVSLSVSSGNNNNINLDSNTVVLSSNFYIGSQVSGVKIRYNKFGRGDIAGTNAWKISSNAIVISGGNTTKDIEILNNELLFIDGNGFQLNQISNVKIDGNYIGCSSDNLQGSMGTSFGNGISLTSCTNATISNNRIQNAGSGIIVNISPNVTISDNTIGLNSYGISLYGNSTDVISVLNNYIGITKNGVSIPQTNNNIYVGDGIVTLRGNTIANGDESGVYVSSGTVKLRNTVIYNSKYDNFRTNSTLKPVILNYTSSRIISGTSAASDSIEIYESDGRAYQDYRAPLIKLLGSGVADINGNWSIKLPDTLGFSGKQYNFAALSTTRLGVTSDLSNQLFTGDFNGLCIVKTDSIYGSGSFDNAIGCALNFSGDSKIIFEFDKVKPTYSLRLNTNGVQRFVKEKGILEIDGSKYDNGEGKRRITINGYANPVKNVKFKSITTTGSDFYGMTLDSNVSFINCDISNFFNLIKNASNIYFKNNYCPSFGIVQDLKGGHNINLINNKFLGGASRFGQADRFSNVNDVIIDSNYFYGGSGRVPLIEILDNCYNVKIRKNIFGVDTVNKTYENGFGGALSIISSANVEVSNNIIGRYGNTGPIMTVVGGVNITVHNNRIGSLSPDFLVPSSNSYTAIDISNSGPLYLSNNVFGNIRFPLNINTSKDIYAINNYFNILPNGEKFELGAVSLNPLLRTDIGANYRFVSNRVYIGISQTYGNVWKCNNCPLSKNIIINDLASDASKQDSIVTSIRSTYSKPTFTTYKKSAGSVELSGTAQVGDTVEIFTSNNVRENAIEYIGYAVTSATGWKFLLPKAFYKPLSDSYVIATARSKQGNTSGLTAQYRISATSCIVKNTLDFGDGSLRNAINCSNNNPGLDSINFAIPGNGPYIIKPETTLPAINDEVILNGFTQSGHGKYDIVLDGATIGGIGLKLWDGTGPRPDSIKIKGLEIKNFGNAIYSSTTELTNVEIDS
ncbi:MAG: right-handed parallel beta-helix repeat-containing protein, partial [Opitutaceae bacterium]|nr:right-handed parallel beta-helix repeat-containing protein [Cytophagales bacterium]